MSCDVDRDPDAISKNEGEEGGAGTSIFCSKNTKKNTQNKYIV